MTKTKYYFPLLFVRPDADWEAIDDPPFRIARRLWETSTFDLATLATRHKLHLPYQVMDVMLAHCNAEVCVETKCREDAVDLLHTLLLGLYIQGLSPTLAPFATTYSVNDYSGINSRDSTTLRNGLPEGLRTGLTSDVGTLEAWPVHLSFSCHLVPDRMVLSPDGFRAAAANARTWRALETDCATLRVVRDAAQSAPLLSSRDQSLLHIWCALEALFPRVSTEVSFRISLYLAQLTRTSNRSQHVAHVRKAYDLRSRVAHGSKRDITNDEWSQAWCLLMDAATAVLSKAGLPDEETLLAELLSSGEERAAQQVDAADGPPGRG